MYSRVNHPQEVTKEVKFHVWRGLSITLFLFCHCSNILFKHKADARVTVVYHHSGEAKWKKIMF